MVKASLDDEGSWLLWKSEGRKEAKAISLLPDRKYTATLNTQLCVSPGTSGLHLSH